MKIDLMELLKIKIEKKVKLLYYCYIRMINIFDYMERRNMLKNIYVNGYKGFNELEISKLTNINIIVGANNIGKTSLLEAIEFLSNPSDLYRLWKRLSVRKENPNLYYRIGNLFNKNNDKGKMVFRFNYDENKYIMKIDKKEEIIIETQFNDHGNISSIDKRKIIKNLISKRMKKYFVNETNEELNKLKELLSEDDMVDKINDITSELISLKRELKEQEEKRIKLNIRTRCSQGGTKLETLKVNETGTIFEAQEKKGNYECILLCPINYLKGDYEEKKITEIIENQQKELLIEPLRYFDQNIIDINYSAVIKDYTLTLKSGETKFTLPISEFGDGLKKTLVLLSYIYSMKNGILLIDEIENGLHKDVLLDVYKALILSAQTQNVQIILTTHSLEAIKTLSHSVDNINNIGLHRIEKFKNKIYVDSYIGEELSNYLFNIGGDPR